MQPLTYPLFLNYKILFHKNKYNQCPSSKVLTLPATNSSKTKIYKQSKHWFKGCQMMRMLDCGGREKMSIEIE